MIRTTAKIELWASEDGTPDLPSETRSMLFRFDDERATPVSIGADVIDHAGNRFVAGSRHERVSMTF